MPTRTRSNRALLLYLLLNIVVSAAATLAVLYVWDAYQKRDLPPPVDGLGLGGGFVIETAASPTAGAVEALPPETLPELPPPDVPVIEIVRATGIGDVNFEALTLRRVGEGDLYMAGWQLFDEGGNTYTFPSSPELVLYKDGGVQIYTRGGTDTATEIYWNRSAPVYEPTELITLVDPAGNIRATYRVP